jgi:hypothetical protein
MLGRQTQPGTEDERPYGVRTQRDVLEEGGGHRQKGAGDGQLSRAALGVVGCASARRAADAGQSAEGRLECGQGTRAQPAHPLSVELLGVHRLGDRHGQPLRAQSVNDGQTDHGEQQGWSRLPIVRRGGAGWWVRWHGNYHTCCPWLDSATAPFSGLPIRC